jgi:hypothetical protein
LSCGNLLLVDRPLDTYFYNTICTVDNKSIYSALETAKKYYVTSKEGREFIDKNLARITSLLLSRSPRNLSAAKDRLGQSENDYVEKGVRYALQLVNDDLRTNAHKFTAKCNTLDALKRILDYKDVYYEDSPPEVRMDKICVFQRIKGFYHLAIYLNARANTSSFPEWELVHRALTASHEGILFQKGDTSYVNLLNKFRKEAKNMTVGAMKHLKSMKKDVLEAQDVHQMSTIIKDIKQLHLDFALNDPKAALDYFAFCKVMIVQLLTLQSMEHKQHGQDMLHELIETVHSFRPAIGAYNVNGAGISVVNGMYSMAPNARDDGGNVIPGVDVSYERIDQTTGKKLKLFLDTTFEEGSATWCISEEHDDETRDPDYTDYYTVIPDVPQRYPPLRGWEVSEGSKGPAPTLQPLPKMIPIREEHKTIKEDLSKWLLEKKVTDLVVGADIGASVDDGTISSLMEALDVYMKDSNYVSPKMANLFVSILPSIQRQAPPNAPPRGFSQSSSSMAALEAAKQRLASAERWEETTSRALKNAQSEHDTATIEVEEARAYLERLDQQYHHSYQNGNEERELSLRNIFESSDGNKDMHDSVDSSITSATGAIEDRRQTASSMNVPRRKIGRSTFRAPSKNRRGS